MNTIHHNPTSSAIIACSGNPNRGTQSALDEPQRGLSSKENSDKSKQNKHRTPPPETTGCAGGAFSRKSILHVVVCLLCSLIFVMDNLSKLAASPTGVGGNAAHQQRKETNKPIVSAPTGAGGAPMTKSIDFVGFNITSVLAVETLESRRASIPNGVYKAKATSALRRPTKQCPDCWYWLITFTFEGSEYDGLSLPGRFNIVNTNPQAEEIGRGQFRHYLQCIGNLAPTCEADLCGVSVLLTVQNRKTKFVNANGVDVETTVSEVVRIEALVDQSECNGTCPVPTNSSAQDEPVPF